MIRFSLLTAFILATANQIAECADRGNIRARRFLSSVGPSNKIPKPWTKQHEAARTAFSALRDLPAKARGHEIEAKIADINWALGELNEIRANLKAANPLGQTLASLAATTQTVMEEKGHLPARYYGPTWNDIVRFLNQE